MLTDAQIKLLELEDKRKYFLNSIVKVRLNKEQKWKFQTVLAISHGDWYFEDGNYRESLLEISLDFPKSGYFNFANDSAFFGYLPSRQFKKGLSSEWCYIDSFLGKLKAYSTQHCFIHTLTFPNVWPQFFSSIEETHNPDIIKEINFVVSGKKFSSALNRDFAISQNFFINSNGWTLWCRGRACGDYLSNGKIIPFKGTTFTQEMKDFFIPIGIEVKEENVKI